MKEYDVLIVGGGPIGIACALEAQKKGLTYVVVEKGCIANSLYNYPLNMTFFSTSEKLEIDDIPFISIKSKPQRAEALEYYRRIVTSNELDLRLFEAVKDIRKEKKGFTVTSSKTVYSTKQVIVATGFYDIPNRMGVPGEDLPKVSHYYKDPHYYAGQKVVVVGASNSSVDAALEIYRKGGDVTMVVRGEEIGRRVKYWVRPDIENRIAEGAVKAWFQSTVKEIREGEIVINTPEVEQVLPNDFVLALTGYMPNFAFLEKIGVKLSDDGKFYPSYDPETMETNVGGLYLAGVICGGMDTHLWFIENSRIHAKLIIKDILRKYSGETVSG
ncbi:YpdA family putative bacillithiol disulfide reductase [Sinomicrobium weinanense]|uniref:YpdA family putative bacillithiol disulfide reductase n=1 Tax=Sinomicrobium weinanense TaxID=2842200 RepID=A0A926JS52_9FLAO|nr:YpdA family putative bacillithiol disulfide reductase [Sinomicrobium weinanense]MBC9796221.1 YpdA family putative bacillithiol disulfide reductase [Sinomicrobium weinanense]MBU3122324.1 YpdA family putative bacillithiol disulfide reductase [Sinomicrobium weinanense]